MALEFYSVKKAAGYTNFKFSQTKTNLRILHVAKNNFGKLLVPKPTFN